jgi:hypothetical protein
MIWSLAHEKPQKKKGANAIVFGVSMMPLWQLGKRTETSRIN